MVKSQQLVVTPPVIAFEMQDALHQFQNLGATVNA
jgi:hypothetical protein